MITVSLPALRGSFGPRVESFSVHLEPTSLREFLGHDPRSANWKNLDEALGKMYGEVQRKTQKARIEGLMKYFRERFTEEAVVAGALPAVSIAFMETLPFTPVRVGASKAVGLVTVPSVRENRRVVIDGLGRISAALSLFDFANSSEGTAAERRAAAAILDDFTIPAVLYAPRVEGQELDTDDLKQIFHDFNFKSVKITTTQALAMDRSSIYTRLAELLAEEEPIVNRGGMRIGTQKVEGQAPLVEQKDLITFVKGAVEGEGWMRKAAHAEPVVPSITRSDIPEVISHLAEYLDPIYEAEDISNPESILIDATAWYALAAIYHDLTTVLTVPDKAPSIRKLAEIDWRHTNPMWVGLFNTLEKPKKIKGRPRSFTYRDRSAYSHHIAIAKILRDHLGLQKLLDERKAEQMSLL